MEAAILEILPRLPLKSLLRFRVLSKVWKKEIESPTLARKRLAIAGGWPILAIAAPSPKILRFLYMGDEARAIDFNVMSKNWVVEFLVGTCNGITCITTCILDYAASDDEDLGRIIESNLGRKIVLVDHLKKEAIYIPDSQDLDRVYGFGYDAERGRYKIVVLFEEDGDHRNGCCVYSLGGVDTVWKEISSHSLPSEVVVDNCKHQSLFSDGNIYWVQEKLKFDESKHKSCLLQGLVKFDLHSGNVAFIGPPPEFPEHLNEINKMEFRCKPALWYVDSTCTSLSFHLGTVNASSFFWTKETVNFSIPCGVSNNMMLRLVESASHLVVTWLNPDDGLYTVCNVHNGKEQQTVAMEVEADADTYGEMKQAGVLLSEPTENIPHLQALVPEGAGILEYSNFSFTRWVKQSL